jgi:septal ring factor EnvC (AmiA/AmiB activator)
VEEQQEILARINDIRRENTMAPAARTIPAAGKDFLFPLLVNGAAALLLLAGFLFLSFMHGRENSVIRRSPSSLGSAEGQILREIRRNAARQLQAKDREIADVSAMLAQVNRELADLVSGLEEAPDVLARESDLRNLLEVYRHNLAGLQEERQAILEAARAQEADLYVRMELSSPAPPLENQAALSAAREELFYLSTEQERRGLIEAQISGYYGEVHRLLLAGRFGEAADTLVVMREYLDTPSFQAVPGIGIHRALNTAAINALETLAKEAAFRGGNATWAAEEIPPAPEDQSADQAGAYESAIAALRTRNTEIGQTAAEQERTIASLKTRNTELERTISEQESAIASLKTQVEALVGTLETLRQTHEVEAQLRNE